MPRWFSPLQGMLFALVLCAPSLLVVQFHVRRAYIERELCVQREVMDAMRTCHGECHLSKKFKALEHEAEAGYPAERMDVRTEPRVMERSVVSVTLPLVEDRYFPALRPKTAQGFAGNVDPVPKG